MQSEVYRMLSVAAACNLSSDVAYEMLKHDFISSFATAYENREKSAEDVSVLDAFIRYAMEELPIRTGVAHNVVYELRSKREAIVDTFLNCDLSTMMTQLASRKTILEHIRQYLRKENELPGMYAKINSSKVNIVFTQFLEMFKRNCAHAFQYRGEFVVFVMNCFIKFYYRGHKRDIWALIREADLERREVEQSAIVEKELQVEHTDDLLIHDLLLNICLVNDMIFRHSGQSDGSHGVQYDIYYLVLCLLCERKVAKINEALGNDLVQFVDPLDRREAWLGLKTNQGIAAKIRNAKELVTYIYDYVAAGNLSVAGLSDLRDYCFTLGKHDREGRNCIWEDVVKGGETARHLDNPKSAVNYERFDQLLKGVISVHSLMEGIESRGIYLVDSYQRELFQDTDIIRYMDYLSSVEYIPLMRKLQQEPSDQRTLDNGLLEFNAMVETYAGSYHNKQTHIRENQYYAITHGFLVRPKIKQTTVPTSQQEVMQTVAGALDAIPRSYKEYVFTLSEQQRAQVLLQDWVDVSYSEIIDRKYNSKYHNSFINRDPDKAAYYLRGVSGAGVQSDLDTMEWRVGTANYEAITYGIAYGVFVPLEHVFLFYDVQGQDSVFTETMDSVVQSYHGSFADGCPTVDVNMVLNHIHCSNYLEGIGPKLQRSIGFPLEIGIRNLGKPDITKRVAGLKVSRQHRNQVLQYYTWMDENSRAQHSFIELLKCMFTDAVFLMCGRENVLTVERGHDITMAKQLFDSLLTGEFKTESLEWALRRLRSEKFLETPDWSKRAFVMRKVDTSLLDYLFGGEIDLKIEYKDLSAAIASGRTLAEKFVLAYNHVYVKLLFLRELRDAYSLLVNTSATDASTLVCELDQRFGVDTKLRSFLDDIVDYGIRVETLGHEEVRAMITQTKKMCVQKFRILTRELTEYVGDCRDEIAKLVDYNIVAQDIKSSRFSDIGAAFAILPPYPETQELLELRRVASVDAAGFFLMGGSYFQGRSGSSVYYVHRSGRMVRDVRGRFEPVDYNFNDEASVRSYTDIIRKGLAMRGQD